MEDEVFGALTKLGCSAKMLIIIRNILNALGAEKARFRYDPILFVDNYSFSVDKKESVHYFRIEYCGNPYYRYCFASVSINLKDRVIRTEVSLDPEDEGYRLCTYKYNTAQEAAEIIKKSWKAKYPNLEEEDFPKRWMTT